MDCLGDAEVILFGLEGHFFGQKEWFKTILGPVSCFFCCYYGWLQWSDPERLQSVLHRSGRRRPDDHDHAKP
jgi:hypothetical protein